MGKMFYMRIAFFQRQLLNMDISSTLNLLSANLLALDLLSVTSVRPHLINVLSIMLTSIDVSFQPPKSSPIYLLMPMCGGNSFTILKLTDVLLVMLGSNQR